VSWRRKLKSRAEQRSLPALLFENRKHPAFTFIGEHFKDDNSNLTVLLFPCPPESTIQQHPKGAVWGWCGYCWDRVLKKSEGIDLVQDHVSE
jgi:hypothetical protein